MKRITFKKQKQILSLSIDLVQALPKVNDYLLYKDEIYKVLSTKCNYKDSSFDVFLE